MHARQRDRHVPLLSLAPIFFLLNSALSHLLKPEFTSITLIRDRQDTLNFIDQPPFPRR